MEHINGNFLKNCYNLKTVEFNTARGYWSSAFDMCINLSSIGETINVSTVATTAFRNTKISNFSAPLTRVHTEAFANCYNLSEVYFLNTYISN